jgi:hypothetical protein
MIRSILNGRKQNLKIIYPRLRTGNSFSPFGGEESDTLGSVTDIETDADNNIYVLDMRGVSIRKYDSNGNLLYTYGGVKGRGPTDLYRPVDIEIGPDGNIYVADSFSEIKILQNSDQGIEYETSMLTPGIIPASMCILKDDLFIRSVAENKTVSDTTVFNLVHVYSLENHKYLRGFGAMYQSPRLGANRRLSGGFAQLACQESTDTIVYGFEYFSYLYGYSSQGKLKWVSKLDPFKDGNAPEETVRSGRSVRWSFGSGGGDGIQSITPFFDDSFLVQVLRSEENEEGNHIRTSYVVSSKDGTYKNIGDIFPKVFNLTDSFAITANTDRYPGVEVLSFKCKL